VDLPDDDVICVSDVKSLGFREFYQLHELQNRKKFRVLLVKINSLGAFVVIFNKI